MMMIKPRRRRLLVVTWLCASYISVAHSFVITVDSPRILLFGAPPSVKRRGSPAAPLYSFSSPQQPQNEPLLLDNDKSPPFDSFIKDVTTLFMYTCWCCLVALAISTYQDFDVSHIKPQGILRDQALYGMAYGNDMNSILPSYNTVMQQHRELRLTMWNQPLETLPRQDAAVVSIVKALQSIQELKKMANNYEWDDMQTALRQPLFTSQLEEACSVLRRTAASTDARDEIGFDWGSCAWRHCGAQADAQEALAELYNLIGVLEPFECLFCLDIIERSLHDILAVSNVNAAIQVPVYTPYQSRGQVDGDSALDMDYLQALKEMKGW